MTDQTVLSFSGPSAAGDGVAVVFADEGGKFTPAAQDLDKKTKGLLTKAAQITTFKGKKGTSVDVLAPQGVKSGRIVLVGLGKPGAGRPEPLGPRVPAIDRGWW